MGREADPVRAEERPAGIHRSRLCERLDRIPGGGVGVLVAPAGSGKSMLASQWVASRPDLRAMGLTLTPRHDDAVAFADDLMAALAATVPGLEAGLGASIMTGGAALGDLFVERLADGLAALPEPVVIVLDDVHVITSHGILSDLDRLVASLPTTTRLVLISRWDLPLHLGRPRVAGRVVELRAHDLAFAVDEAHDLVAAVSGCDLPEAAARMLVERTDGWAAGLQLAAISLQDTADPATVVDRFAGSDQLVVEYLTQEVLDGQDDATRRFLLDTSVLPWLSGPLCDAVTGRTDSAERLRQLHGRSLFLTPLEGSAERFRYHQLFADLLRYELEVERPGDATRLRTRAARWLQAHGHHAEAVEEFLAAGEPQVAFEVVAATGQALFERGQSATLARWLSAIERAMDHPPLTAEVNLLAAQVAADETVAAAETYRRLIRRSDVGPGVRAAAAALYACLGFDDLDTLEVLAAEACHLVATCLDVAEAAGLADNEYVTYGWFAAGLVAAERLDVDEAQRCLAESALRNQRRRDTSFFDVQRHLEARHAVLAGADADALAVLDRPARSAVEPAVLVRANERLRLRLWLRRGDLPRARAIVARSRRPDPGASAVDLALVAGDVEEARRQLDQWQPDTDDVTGCVEHSLRRAAVALAAGDRAGARLAVADAVALAEPEDLRRPFVDVPALQPVLRDLANVSGEQFARSLLAVSARLSDAGHQRVTGIVEPLTERELEVLRYLPSRLSNADIAAELYVSTNTVKTHVRNIYRKLEVPGRDAAVDRADALGLI